MSATSRACWACRATSPSSLPRAYLIGRPAVCCGVVLPVCPCVVSFSNVHEHDTHDLLRLGCHEDATRKTASVEFKPYADKWGAPSICHCLYANPCARNHGDSCGRESTDDELHREAIAAAAADATTQRPYADYRDAPIV